jgi:hypothetical protein
VIVKVSSYVIVAYQRVSADRRDGAEALGLNVEELALSAADRGEYVWGKRNLALDLSQKFASDDEDALFRKTIECRGAATTSGPSTSKKPRATE